MNTLKHLQETSLIGNKTILGSNEDVWRVTPHIWFINRTVNRTVNFYFYHNYKATFQFNLSEELKKKDYIITIETLFPNNPEFEKLRNCRHLD